MKQSLIITNTIAINAKAAKVWDVLTKPEQTKKYMYGCETVSDWKVGSELLWKGEYEGKEMVFVKGIIQKLEPEKFLTYTAIDPNSTIDDTSESHIVITYSLTSQGGLTTLTVTQGDYSKVNEGERRFKEANNGGEGWNPLLIEIKKIAESL